MKNGLTLAAFLLAGFFLATVARSRLPRAEGQDAKPVLPTAGSFEYFPRGSQGWPELCDTHSGTVYRRTPSGTWEVYCKPPQ